MGPRIFGFYCSLRCFAWPRVLPALTFDAPEALSAQLREANRNGVPRTQSAMRWLHLIVSPAIKCSASLSNLVDPSESASRGGSAKSDGRYKTVLLVFIRIVKHK